MHQNRRRRSRRTSQRVRGTAVTLTMSRTSSEMHRFGSSSSTSRLQHNMLHHLTTMHFYSHHAPHWDVDAVHQKHSPRRRGRQRGWMIRCNCKSNENAEKMREKLLRIPDLGRMCGFHPLCLPAPPSPGHSSSSSSSSLFLDPQLQLSIFRFSLDVMLHSPSRLGVPCTSPSCSSGSSPSAGTDTEQQHQTTTDIHNRL